MRVADVKQPRTKHPHQCLHREALLRVQMNAIWVDIVNLHAVGITDGVKLDELLHDLEMLRVALAAAAAEHGGEVV